MTVFLQSSIIFFDEFNIKSDSDNGSVKLWIYVCSLLWQNDAGKIQNTRKDKSSVSVAVFHYFEMRTLKHYWCEYRVSPKWKHAENQLYYLVKIMQESRVAVLGYENTDTLHMPVSSLT
jgi:hypothetical protein